MKSLESIDLELSNIYSSCFVSLSNMPRLYVLPSNVLMSVLLSITPLINLDEYVIDLNASTLNTTLSSSS